MACVTAELFADCGIMVLQPAVHWKLECTGS